MKRSLPLNLPWCESVSLVNPELSANHIVMGTVRTDRLGEKLCQGAGRIAGRGTGSHERGAGDWGLIRHFPTG